MKFLIGFILLFSIQGCKTDNSTSTGTSLSDAASSESLLLEKKSITVLEVIQVANYTYLRGKEKQEEIWLAVPTIEAKPGDVLYYENGMLMTNFESKELKRTFERILFVDTISKSPDSLGQKNGVPAKYMSPDKATLADPPKVSSNDSIKQKVNIEPVKNGVSIADILKNPKAFEGKSVIVKGKVTKYTAGVMGKNWVHIQDGTDYNNKFEIVITTINEVKDGDTATFEGVITLNKDLGYGYFFEVLMENAKVIK